MPAGDPGPSGEAISLRDCALAAVAATVRGADDGGTAPELGYLRERLEMLLRFHPSWLTAARAAFRSPGPTDRPLVSLAEQLGLSLGEALAAALAAAVEDDVMAGRALARVQSPLGGSRPTLGLLAVALGEASAGCDLVAELLTGPAVRSGLLTVQGQPAPVPERAVSVPAFLCLGLKGWDAEPAGSRLDEGAADRVPLPPSVLCEVERHARALLHESNRQLLIRTGSEAEGRAVAAAVAQAMGKRAALVPGEPPEGFTPWLILRALLPVYVVDSGPGERKRIAPSPLYEGPSVIVAGPDGAVDSPHGIALTWRLEVPRRAERETLWRGLTGDAGLAGDLAARHRHGSGRIAYLGRLSRHRAALRGESHPELQDIADASWGSEAGGIEALAEPVPGRITDDALVVSQLLRAELDHLLQRCQVRDGLADDLGVTAAARYRPGVRALFVGPSGTGKTLAASWLATRLGLPLYRVDLASVTSKYIGETEKNLSQLLARTEQAEVVLLFDEADAMFGKRTDVKDANDRFANAQTNYLLQRIESYDGIVLLTSNSRNRLDSAFARRLDLIVEFPLPGPEERRRLWDAHLGRRHALSPSQLNLLAAKVEVAGGHIRNIVLAAAVHAAEAGAPVEYAHLLAAVAQEFRKLGRQVPTDVRRPPEPPARVSP